MLGSDPGAALKPRYTWQPDLQHIGGLDCVGAAGYCSPSKEGRYGQGGPAGQQQTLKKPDDLVMEKGKSCGGPAATPPSSGDGLSRQSSHIAAGQYPSIQALSMVYKTKNLF